MHSYKDGKDGKKIWTACCECDRGGNGTAADKCSCGGFIKQWGDKLGCWVGKPLVCRCGHPVIDHADQNGGSHTSEQKDTGYCGCVFNKDEALQHLKLVKGLFLW